MATSQVSPSAVEGLKTGPEMERLLARLGEAVANDARTAAPKRTGALAASIDYELGRDEAGDYVRISWTPETWYGKFAELGTSRQKPTPFLRPALYVRRSL